MSSIQKIIEQCQLLPHPEGGYYAETYRSKTWVPTASGLRPASTCIYFLLTAGNFSAFHRIKSDEAWHHYEGDAVHIHVLHGQGNYECIALGKNLEQGEQQQAFVPAGAWFGSECVGPLGYAWVGCTVAPGFDFADFELASAQGLMKQFPQQAALIQRLTR